ncbi:initiation factor eIF2 gamma, C terminal-domain-containing protein [Suillus discolor]|uniref:Initiation factor eIF2 gamma, C terminal-domain-containing protein n=1 Tax=Suillus discolor TaxID=1912936 RepID=A0A9P7F2A3_9AGAM|nr:initiation factor eIF2 gamma, C terminal-domain-containing protein [Suillus discolor]KAG2102280.1 initiation factor eIF2 gamma, C terminal-domain-containing protein [Suillus discolor]
MHLAAVEIMKLENIIILQNKVVKSRAHQKSIAAFVKDTISMQLKYNIDAVNEYIVKRIPIATSRFSAGFFSACGEQLLASGSSCGSSAGHGGEAPEGLYCLFLLRRLLGVRAEDKKQTKVSKLAKNELLLINIGSTSTGGWVLSVKGDLAKIQLTSPACTEVGEKVALSRRIEKHWRLVGEVYNAGRCWSWTDARPTFLHLM